MKRLFKGAFLSLLTVSIIASSCLAVFVTVDTPGYDIFYSDDSLVSNIFISLKEQDGIAFADVNYKARSFRYQVEISYDDLASKVMLANQNGFICSLYKNELVGYWVGYVYDVDYSVFDGGQEISGTLCNSSGYVYVAEIDTTGSDSVDLLTQILVRLTLVESYVKSTYFELWEQGGVLDFIQSVLVDVESNLYYNGKSAAYYLYKIESHLATIANNSGTSDGSSSGTDLSGITTQLDTLTGLTGIIQLRADAILSSLGVANQYLYAVSTKLDGVSSMVTSLNTATTYLSWISSDVEDVLEELETATDLIGSTSLDVDALVTGMGVTQDLIAAANTNLTTMINKQELTFDYLADLSRDLGIVISNQYLVLGHLEILNSMNTTLVAIDNRLPSIFAKQLEAIGHLATLSENLITVLGNQSELISLLQEDGAFATGISSILANQQQTNSSLSSINDALIHNELSAGHSLASLSDKLITVVNRMNGMLGNQGAILALLQEEGAFTTDLSGVLADLGTVISNQELVLGHLEILNSMNSTLVAIDNRLPSIFAKQLEAIGHLKTLSENLITVLGNQEAILTLLQEDGAFTTDLSGILENQQKLIDLIEDLELTTNVTIENIENIKIDVTNKAYEVFYITDSEGNEQNLADFSGDVLTISGRLLNFFFKVAFDDAMDSVDSALDDMTEFYLDDSVVVGGSSLWE